jgi:putative oxidoreductase
MGLAMFYGHGLGKLMSYQQRAGKFADPLGLGSEATFAFAVLAEVLCALAVAAGFFTRLAAIPPMLVMATAILTVHLGDPFKDWEKALLFLAGYLAIAVLGPGKASLDAKFRGVS